MQNERKLNELIEHFKELELRVNDTQDIVTALNTKSEQAHYILHKRVHDVSMISSALEVLQTDANVLKATSHEETKKWNCLLMKLQRRDKRPNLVREENTLIALKKKLENLRKTADVIALKKYHKKDLTIALKQSEEKIVGYFKRLELKRENVKENEDGWYKEKVEMFDFLDDVKRFEGVYKGLKDSTSATEDTLNTLEKIGKEQNDMLETLMAMETQYEAIKKKEKEEKEILLKKEKEERIAKEKEAMKQKEKDEMVKKLATLKAQNKETEKQKQSEQQQTPQQPQQSGNTSGAQTNSTNTQQQNVTNPMSQTNTVTQKPQLQTTQQNQTIQQPQQNPNPLGSLHTINTPNAQQQPQQQSNSNSMFTMNPVTQQSQQPTQQQVQQINRNPLGAQVPLTNTQQPNITNPMYAMGQPNPVVQQPQQQYQTMQQPQQTNGNPLGAQVSLNNTQQSQQQYQTMQFQQQQNSNPLGALHPINTPNAQQPQQQQPQHSLNLTGTFNLTNPPNPNVQQQPLMFWTQPQNQNITGQNVWGTNMDNWGNSGLTPQQIATQKMMAAQKQNMAVPVSQQTAQMRGMY
ncbi:hypothetical protein EIN_054870 [Entamoeba invadens IP1]|uniref:hypothetical protein n=1 Tax=Entamoeba invadens IP1 TaxID=370355 RepID=UPI0002C3D88B|nr:hypothetical protein EIN_054870 [Entamoeba invadens IP1]ELP93192.1 hypothetical protein EIN_054870 [Entamoeba invadens IP1]|eukprot:XP_004259963.1 hypothetical protein EIN_054870 [Entamoeba invadens IP1]